MIKLTLSRFTKLSLKLTLMALALCLFVNSCKKESLNGEKPDPSRAKEMLAYKNGPKVETINFDQFKSKANLNSLGLLKKDFIAAPTSKDKLMAINSPQTYVGFALNTDSIKVIKAKGHTIYVFTAKLSSKKAISFQNLTIDEGPDQTLAFINTYTPTKKWIKDWKKGKRSKFEGSISVVYLNLDKTTPSAVGNAPINGKISAIKNPNTLANAPICTSTTYYYEVPYNCGSGLHWPGDSSCALTGADAAGYLYIEDVVTTCVDDPNTGGGGGGTTPTPPPGYDPCDDTPPVISAISAIKAKGASVMVIPPPTDCDLETPVKDVRNKTTDPCISKTVEAALAANGDIEGALADIIQKFDASKSVTVNIFDGATSSGAPGQYQGGGLVGNVFQANITLQTSYFQNTSKESVIATLIHEFVHAYIHTSGNQILEADHDVISSKYITPMAAYLKQSFGIDLKDAYALAWSGVPDSKAWREASIDFEFTMSNGGKITKGETGSLSGPYKLATNDPSNIGFTKGTKICD